MKTIKRLQWCILKVSALVGMPDVVKKYYSIVLKALFNVKIP